MGTLGCSEVLRKVVASTVPSSDSHGAPETAERSDGTADATNFAIHVTAAGRRSSIALVSAIGNLVHPVHIQSKKHKEAGRAACR